MTDANTPKSTRSGKGFRRAAQLVESRIRSAGQSRGFAVARLLTRWADIVGPEIAATAEPVDVRYGREGLGATLTLLVPGPAAPRIEMEKERIRAAVNACYGYAAISRIRLTQAAGGGFSERRAAFDPAPREEVAPPPGPQVAQEARTLTRPVADDGLRAALEELGTHVLSHRQDSKRPPA